LAAPVDLSVEQGVDAPPLEGRTTRSIDEVTLDVGVFDEDSVHRDGGAELGLGSSYGFGLRR
jgi:hypothetical protein